MDRRTDSRAPLIIAIVVLVLPFTYIGSYFALVMPGGRAIPITGTSANGSVVYDDWLLPDEHYRCAEQSCGVVFWPLEQIDRRVRPQAWRDSEWWISWK